MRLSQKKNCEGCKAVNTLGGKIRCELGFNNRGPYIKTLGINRILPQEPCYKPRTYDELFRANELIRNLPITTSTTRKD